MSVKITTEVIGLRELEIAMKQLQQEMAGKGVRATNITKLALNAVAKNRVKPRMIAAAPESKLGSHIDWHKSSNGKWVHDGENGQRAAPGRLKRAIFVKPERNPRRLSEVVYVGPRLGKDRNDPAGAWYAAIAEMHGGENGKGKGFMRNSIRPESDTQALGREMGVRIERAAKKIGNDNLRAVGAKAKRDFV